jgi:hypothetical protein
MNKENDFFYEINLKGIIENEKLNELFIEFLNKNLKNQSKPQLKNRYLKQMGFYQ